MLCGVTLRRCAAQMSGVKTSHSMGGARADRAPSVLQPPIPSHKPLGSGRTLARSYLAGFFRTRAHLPTRHHHRLPQVPPCPGPNVQILPLLLPPHHLPPHRLAPHPQACWLTAAKPSTDADPVLQVLKDKPIPASAARDIEDPFLRRETKRALRSMAKRKAAGPDKFPAEFYHRGWI